MSKEKIKTNRNVVGAGHVSARNKKHNGITLVALIITIIVMLILVGVTVTVALNGGIFTKAKDAGNRTEQEMEKELVLLDGTIEVDGKKYASYDDYLNNKEIIVLPTGWTIATTKPEGWSENVTAITDGTNIIPLPNGFKLSTEETEDSIEEGLVLTDGTNEFVWIPVSNASSYTEASFGPLTGTHGTTTYLYDSQEELDYYYGTDYYNYEEDFTYEEDKTNVETSIQIYGGFYVGRYETIIDGTIIGVKQGKKVLTTATLLKEGINTKSNEPYYYRWWGLYKAQKDMYLNNQSVGSLMISRKQWSEIMTFTGYSNAKRATDTYTNINEADLSGSAYKTESTKYDVSKNIYDLAGNISEITANLFDTNRRANCGGHYSSSVSASYNAGRYPSESNSLFGSRVILYIK